MAADLCFSHVMNRMNETTTGDPHGAAPFLDTYGAIMA